jgi:hypothetical protein
MRRCATLLACALGATLMTAIAAADAESIPAGCPRRFDQMTTGLPTACLFVGRFSDHCGGDAVALFAGDGTALVVSLALGAPAPPLFIPAHVVSPTEGKLVRWRSDLDLNRDPGSGSVSLAADGETLHITLADTTVMAGDCRFDGFVGHFAGMVAAGGGVRSAVGPAPAPRPALQPVSATLPR